MERHALRSCACPCNIAVSLTNIKKRNVTMRALLRKCLFAAGYVLSRVPSPEIDKYPTAIRPSVPRYLNIGAGTWRHPMWHNLDNPRDDYSKSRHADLSFDLTSGGPWPIEDSSLDLIFSSHTIEHLNDKFVGDLCREAYRCLRPGGIIRLTTPDMDLYASAYERRDRSFSIMRPPLPIIVSSSLFCSVLPGCSRTSIKGMNCQKSATKR